MLKTDQTGKPVALPFNIVGVDCEFVAHILEIEGKILVFSSDRESPVLVLDANGSNRLGRALPTVPPKGDTGRWLFEQWAETKGLNVTDVVLGAPESIWACRIL